MLAEVVQIRNVRRVKVNAQVTFVIYVLEFIANWSIAIVWTLVHGSSSEITITMGLMWFHVILPYIFLMNTSHNKDLLIDDGWWNTLNNAVGTNTRPNYNSSNEQPIPLSEQRTSRKTSFEMGDINRDQKDKDKDETTKWVHIRRQTRARKRNKERSDICIISIDDNIPQCSTSSLCPDSTEPSCSDNNGGRFKTNQVPKFHADVISKTVSDSDEENKIPPKSYHLELGEALLSNMFEYIHDEDRYLHYLTQLSKLKDEFNKNKKLSEGYHPFQIVDYPTRKKGKKKNSIFHNSKEQQSNPERKSELFKSKNLLQLTTTELNIERIGKVFDRMETRKHLLKNFEKYCNCEQSFKEFCDIVFDFEESLICN